MTGEKISTWDFDVTGITDYGITLEAIISGQEKIPPQGARIDVAFEGRASGRLSGQVRGVDYMSIRADGSVNLHIHATILTDDGHRIALFADGTFLPRPGEPIADIRENVRLTTAAAEYTWVNARQIWAPGTANVAAGKIHVDAYLE
jgi:hypothetical protein